MNSNKGRVRIIGGEFRGRRLGVVARPDLRPTPDRVRETLFNWLGQRLDGLTCLDLFAGSGALGFEAASRGAARVVMVENDRRAFSALQEYRELLRAKQVELVFGDAMDYLRRSKEAFDLVFLDPPFRQNALALALDELPGRLAPGEWGRDGYTGQEPYPPPFTTIAWRLSHLTEMLAMRADYSTGSRSMTKDAFVVSGDAGSAAAALTEAVDAWRGTLLQSDDAALDTAGYSTYPYGSDAEEMFIDIVWWVNQEILHHGAEIALLRDLYRDSAHRDGAGRG